MLMKRCGDVVSRVREVFTLSLFVLRVVEFEFEIDRSRDGDGLFLRWYLRGYEKEAPVNSGGSTRCSIARIFVQFRCISDGLSGCRSVLF